jgi:outer membrane beta-barrel protein
MLGNEDEEFQSAEIRVIRPRYFNKKHRFEIGIQGALIANEAFFYTALGAGSLTFHLNEQFGLELNGAYGVSRETEDRVILQEDFDIEPQYAPVELYYGGSVLWTPMYGKYQLSTGRLVYFDTFLSGGGGVIGVREEFKHCGATEGKNTQILQYPFFEFGVGQRYFISKNDSLRWAIRSPMYFSNSSDFACNENVSGSSEFNYNINFLMGYSRFI